MSISITDKIIRIMELAMLINPSCTRREKTGNKPTVFVRFSGHCSVLRIDIYSTGWSMEDSENIIHTHEVYLNTEEEEEKLNTALCELEKIYKEIQGGKYNG